jgi:outer membrane protein assembly factor BamB
LQESGCGPGAHRAGDVCLGDSPGSVSCGPGTQLVGNACVSILSDGGVPGAGVQDSGSGSGVDTDGGTTLDFGNQDLTPIPQGDRATSWQIDPAHSGAQPSTRLQPPLKRVWSYDTGGAVGYPIVSDGRVFITSGVSGAAGSRITALDSSTGHQLWGPISLGGAYSGIATASYDVSLARLFVMNGDALVQALDPTNGNAFWTKQLSSFVNEIGPLVSQSGLVFVPQQWNLVVLDGASGATRWTGAEGASPMAAAVTPFAVYTCAVGGGVMARDPTTGAHLWLHAANGDGGGGCYTVVAGSRLYAYDWADPPLVLNLGTGNVEGSFTGPVAPVFADGRAYFLVGKNLEAHDSSNAVAWTFAGDGTLDTQPIGGGGYVYVGGSSGMLYAVDQNGKVVYSDKLPSALTGANSFVSGAPSGFAIAEDKLFVSAGTILYAYATN